jgi:putative transposase
MKYAFIRAHQAEFRVRAMCRVLRVHFSGFYAWLKEPLSLRAQDDARQTALIRQAWSDSGRVYGYRKLTDDLRDQGEQVSENRVARLASLAGVLAQIGYKRRPERYGGKPAVVASNTLDRQFEVDAPDKVWVTDITYIKTHEGWLNLAVVIDLFSLRVVGWSAQPRMTTDLALQALLAAVPYQVHTVLTDNGIQFAEQPRNRNTIYSRPMRFDMICDANGIEHRLTKPNHPWTNGQVERMNRTIKDATVKRYHYDDHGQLRTHLADFLAAYNFARRLKTLSGLTPYEYICRVWTSEPDRFILDPIHQMPGLNT